MVENPGCLLHHCTVRGQIVNPRRAVRGQAEDDVPPGLWMWGSCPGTVMAADLAGALLVAPSWLPGRRKEPLAVSQGGQTPPGQPQTLPLSP